ncbi:MAG: zinc metallopeptidase [Oscillospiraceae bacterium]|nr:zinc metallopeptidase [Oscillospiraceae bacterium]
MLYPYGYYYGFDWTYLYLVLPCVILSLWASHNVNSTFQKYSQQFSIRRLTGAQAAQRVLSANGVHGVRIERVSGNLTDHFDPKTNVIRLSDSVYSNTSTAAIGVACHEAGHAVQYAQGYAPIKLRAAIIPLTNFGSRLAMPLILIGILFSTLGLVSDTLVYLGIACFGLSLVFQLVTLPVEFNASRRAMQVIESANLLTEDEQRGARKTLTAAALTYVAATATALAQLLRLILLFGGRRRRND